MEIRAQITHEPVSETDGEPWTVRVFVDGGLEAIIFASTHARATHSAAQWADARRNADDAGDAVAGDWLEL